MPQRPALVCAVAFLLAITACRRDETRLDDVQKMAYSVKPAVVRVNAYATAEVFYPGSVIQSLAHELQLPLPRNTPQTEGRVTTGAGGSGTGFIIRPDGYVLTSAHVVAPTRTPDQLEHDLRRNGAIAALVRHFPIDNLRALRRGDELDRYIDTIAASARVATTKVVNTIELSNGETLQFRIIRYSPPLTEKGTDLALLRIDHRNLPVLALGDSDSVRVGDDVWAIGYPAVASSTDEMIGGWLSSDSDLEPTFVNGTITAIKYNVAHTPVLQSNVAIYRGNSGGPAVNRRGEVIAISTWGHTEAEQIKFLVPINVAKQLLESAGVVADTDGEFNRNYRAALDAAYSGRWTDARPALDAAGAVFPKSPDVIRFRNDVDRAVRALPVWVLHPVAASTTVVAALAVAGFIVSRGRRPRVARAAKRRITIDKVVAPGRETTATRAQPQLLGRFTILNGAHAGEKLGLGGSGIRIGREDSICEIVLENPKVSRLHAEVVSIDGKVLLIDRNSSNGTFVNDRKIDRHFLTDGDIIYFGGRNAIAVAFHA